LKRGHECAQDGREEEGGRHLLYYAVIAAASIYEPTMTYHYLFEPPVYSDDELHCRFLGPQSFYDFELRTGTEGLSLPFHTNRQR